MSTHMALKRIAVDTDGHVIEKNGGVSFEEEWIEKQIYINVAKTKCFYQKDGKYVFHLGNDKFMIDDKFNDYIKTLEAENENNLLTVGVSI